MKTIFIISFTLLGHLCYSQNKQEIFVPILVSYFPGSNYRIPWEEEVYKDIWVRILTYPLTNPKDSRTLFSTDKSEYYKKINKMLYTRRQCDSLITDYFYRITSKFSYIKQYGQGGYYEQEKSGDRLYRRCVCLPATVIKDLRHGDTETVGVPIKYIEPSDFVKKFKKYKLDSLDLAEAPYYNIFPMDINPSFDCSKATTPIEKAICRDAELAGLDRALMEAFKTALKKDGENVKVHQRVWLQERTKKCEGKNNAEITKILKELYNERIKELNK
jgi:uncharacterized protein YecT (DUF1311 family)